VHRHELPARRGRPCPDPVLAAEEADVLHYVARVVHAGDPLADAEVHVREERVLGVGAADANGPRVPLANLDVDVAHRRIERARARVGRTAAAAAPPGSWWR